MGSLGQLGAQMQPWYVPFPAESVHANITYFGTENFLNVFDNNINTNAPGGHFGVRSDGKWLLQEVMVLFAADAVMTRDAKIQASNDGSTWVDLWTGTLEATRRQVIGIQLLYPQNAGAFTHFRFVCPVTVAGVEFYGVRDTWSILAYNHTANLPARGNDVARNEAIEFARLFNVTRAERGLAPFVWSEELATAARLHAQCMIQNRYFSHDCAHGHGSIGKRAAASGWTGHEANVTELIHQGSATAAAASRDFMNSMGHQAPYMVPRWGYIGPAREGGNTWVVKLSQPDSFS